MMCLSSLMELLMVLIDFSSIMHRMIYSSISSIKPQKIDGKFCTSDFIGLTKYYILQDLFSIHQEHSNRFGDLVICLDRSVNGYWRKDVYPMYKSSRSKGREESEINFQEVFNEIETLIHQMKMNLPWRVIEVPRAEADDIILVLAKEYNKYENILILSPDKDMIQAQRDSDNVFQYSPLTKKWLVPENKHDHMDHWIMEHVCLGDAADEVPKVVDHTEFSDSFIEYLKNQGYNITTPMEFKAIKDSSLKLNLLENYNIYKTNRKGESTGVKDVYKDIRFGPSNLKKVIQEHGSLDKWLDSHPLYRPHYERNYKLVMAEGIPSNIWNEILISYKEAETNYNMLHFENYLKENSLNSILMDLPSIFKFKGELTASDFDW